MAADMARLVEDARAETAVLDDLLAPLDEAGWSIPTPAPGWAIRDQVIHLAYFDEAATTSAVDPDRFRTEAAAAIQRGFGFVDEIGEQHRDLPGAKLHQWFREARARLLDVMGALDPKLRLPWYGPDMSAASSLTARIMETWAHGQDIVDALGAERAPTARLRHVCDIGVRALPNSYRARRRPVPETPVRVELIAPSGELWTWGPEEAPDVVRGPALDFCLVVTQRRHPADTAISTEGPVAGEWMTIAQAFAGPPGAGRQPTTTEGTR